MFSMKKALVVVAFGFAPLFAICQNAVGESNIAQAVRNVGSMQTGFIRLRGATTVGSRVTPFEYDCYFDQTISASGNLQLLVRIDDFQNNIFVNQLVADGKDLWKYDFTNRHYMVQDYTRNQATPPVDTLFQKMSGLSDQYSDMVVLLLRQSFASSGSDYHNWLGGTQATGSADDIIYQALNQSLEFILVGTDPDIYLSSVTSQKSDRLNNYNIYTTWTLDLPTPNFTIDPTLFRFKIPVGSIPISVPN